jgi:hypothetical protein
MLKQISSLLQLRRAAKAQYEPVCGGHGGGLFVGHGKAGRIHRNERRQIFYRQQRYPHGLRVALYCDLESSTDLTGKLCPAQVIKRRSMVLPAV